MFTLLDRSLISLFYSSSLTFFFLICGIFTHLKINHIDFFYFYIFDIQEFCRLLSVSVFNTFCSCLMNPGRTYLSEILEEFLIIFNYFSFVPCIPFFPLISFHLFIFVCVLC